MRKLNRLAAVMMAAALAGANCRQHTHFTWIPVPDTWRPRAAIPA